MATLYHWDLPAALDDRGGWLDPDVAYWFADYARLMYRALGDRVALWVTLNEPWVVTDGGYLRGALAPGHRNLFSAPIATHSRLRGDQLIQVSSPSGPRLGSGARRSRRRESSTGDEAARASRRWRA